MGWDGLYGLYGLYGTVWYGMMRVDVGSVCCGKILY